MGNVHEKLKQKLAGAKAGFGWKPKNGDNRIFVLPPASEFVDNPDGVETLAFQYNSHYFRVEGQQGGDASRCLADIQQKCPACAASRAYSKNPDPGLAEIAKQARQVGVYVFNILDLADLAKGVQRWGANWTCWTKIMEIAANPAWGYVFNPREGVTFVVQLTPKGQSKSGYNAYNVLPEPNKVSVLDVLLANAQGLQALDGLEEATMEFKTAEEIQGLLDAMGFPPLGGVAPRTVAVPVPGVTAPAATRPVVVPIPAAPIPVAAAPTAPAPTVRTVTAIPVPVPAAPAAAAPAPAGEAPAAHYDPGPKYVPKVEEAARPPRAPRCFGDYNPSQHRCQPCPVLAPCQMKMLNIVG